MKKIIVAVAALAMMAGSAYAADWNFYGSARVQTFWSDTDNSIPANDDDTQYGQLLQGNSRIGAKVTVSDELIGRFEYGTGVNIRLLYGEWNFGAGKLLVGQDNDPLNLCGSNQVYNSDGGLEGYGGEMWSGRHAQLKLTFSGFQIAFIENNTDYYTTAGATVDSADVVIPMIQIKYTLAGANWTLNLAGGYQTFDAQTAACNDDITSWGLGLDFAASFGAFSLTAQVNGGENVGNLWYIDVDNGATNFGGGYAKVDGNDVIDNEAIGGRICLAYTFNDMFGVEVGYGYQQTEFDDRGEDEDESQSYYISFPITMAAGVYVVPELGVVDYMDRGQDDITYFGAKWQINF